MSVSKTAHTWLCCLSKDLSKAKSPFDSFIPHPNSQWYGPAEQPLAASMWGIFFSDREACPLQNVHCIYISLSFGWVAFQLLVLHFKPGVKNPPFCRVISHLLGVDMLQILITKKHAEVSFIRGIQS